MTTLRRHRSVWSIYRSLLGLGVVTAAGLLSALLGDVWWDYASWAFLFIPIGLFGYFVVLRTKKT
jgi:uncharacterized membrane protein